MFSFKPNLLSPLIPQQPRAPSRLDLLAEKNMLLMRLFSFSFSPLFSIPLCLVPPALSLTSSWFPRSAHHYHHHHHPPCTYPDRRKAEHPLPTMATTTTTTTHHHHSSLITRRQTNVLWNHCFALPVFPLFLGILCLFVFLARGLALVS